MTSWKKDSYASICKDGKKLTIYANGKIECYIGIKPAKFGKGFYSLYNSLMKDLVKEGQEEREEEIKDLFFENGADYQSYYGLIF